MQGVDNSYTEQHSLGFRSLVTVLVILVVLTTLYLMAHTLKKVDFPSDLHTGIIGIMLLFPVRNDDGKCNVYRYFLGWMECST